MNWDQVENSERFQAYDQRMKNHVKAQWFKQYVTPSDEFQAYDDDRKMRVLSGFFSDPLPEEEPGYGMVVAKSIARGFENLAGGAGSLTRWAGDVLDYSDLEKAGKAASTYFREAAQEGWEAPDPRIFGGTFWENPSLKRAFGIVGEAAPSYTVAIAASMIGGSPAWGAGMLGLLEGGPQAEEAMEAGLSTTESSIVGLASTLGTAVLEYLPISRLLKRKGGFVTGALKGGVEESAQEVTQTVWQNLIAKIGYDETRELAEGIIESAIGGFGVGGPAGGVVSSLNKSREVANEKIKRIREDILKKGVTDPEMDAAVSDMQDQLKSLTEDDVKRVMANAQYPDYTEEIQGQIDTRNKEIEDELLSGEWAQTLKRENDPSYLKRVENQKALDIRQRDLELRIANQEAMDKYGINEEQKIAIENEITANKLARKELEQEAEQRRPEKPRPLPEPEKRPYQAAPIIIDVKSEADREHMLSDEDYLLRRATEAVGGTHGVKESRAVTEDKEREYGKKIKDRHGILTSAIPTSNERSAQNIYDTILTGFGVYPSGKSARDSAEIFARVFNEAQSPQNALTLKDILGVKEAEFLGKLKDTGYKADTKHIKKIAKDRKAWQAAADKLGIDPIYPGAKPKALPKKTTPAESYIEEIKAKKSSGIDFTEEFELVDKAGKPTGQTTETTRDASVALRSVDRKLSIYDKILNCLG